MHLPTTNTYIGIRETGFCLLCLLLFIDLTIWSLFLDCIKFKETPIFFV